MELHKPKPIRFRPCGKTGCRGFTLVEVTIALGLLSFSLVTVLAMLPIGMNSLRESRDTAAFSSILQQIEAEYSSMPYSDIPASQAFYFDRDGRRMESGSAERHLRVEVERALPDYPGMPAQISSRLTDLKISSVRLAGATGDVTVGESTTHTMKIADTGM